MTYKNCITAIGLSIIITLGMSSFLFPSSDSSALSNTNPHLSLKHIIDLALKNNNRFNTLNTDLRAFAEELTRAKETFIQKASRLYEDSDLLQSALNSLQKNEILDTTLYQNEPYVVFYNAAVRSFLFKQKEYHTAKHDIEYKTSLVYYNYCKQQKLITIQRTMIEELDDHYKSIKELYEKGILSKVELMKVETVSAEAEQTLEELNRELYLHTLTLNNVLYQNLEKKLMIEPLQDFAYEYTDFDQWLSISLQNNGIPEDTFMLFLTRTVEIRLRSLYAHITDRKKHISTADDIINKTTKILEFQIKRFKNARSTSNDVIDALQHLTRSRRKRLMILYDYLVAMAESKMILMTSY